MEGCVLCAQFVTPIGPGRDFGSEDDQAEQLDSMGRKGSVSLGPWMASKSRSGTAFRIPRLSIDGSSYRIVATKALCFESRYGDFSTV